MKPKQKQLLVRVDPELHQKAKVKAAKAKVSLSDVIRQLLERWTNGSTKYYKPDKD